MIPRLIRLHNFLSYHECTVDFSGLSLAVLCGRNGDGKSALLDGMTWAVWGEARGKVEDERIHLGSDEMHVTFEFEANGDIFRVIRKRTRGKNGEVHFFHLTELGASTLTGGTSSETQAEIIRRVGMNFQTFANSAFVAQGRADEFTKKAPRERKEVFRNILGLHLYEQVSMLANDRRKEAVTTLKAMDASRGEDEEQLKGLPAVETLLGEVQAALAAIPPVRGPLEAEVGELRQAASQFVQMEAVARASLERLERAELGFASDTQTLATVSGALATAGKIVAEADAVREAHAALLAARGRERQLAALARELEQLREEREQAERQLAGEEMRLRAALNAGRAECENLTAVAEGVAALTNAEAGFAREAAEIEALRPGIEALRELLMEAHGARSRHEAEAKRCKAENARIHARREQLLSLEGEKECPVCRQPLSPGDIEHVVAEYSAQKKALGEQFKAADAARGAAEAESARIEANIVRGEAEQKRMSGELEGRRREHSTVFARAREAAAALPEKTQELAALEVTLERGTFGEAFRRAICTLDEQLRASGYDAEEHARARDAADALQSAEEEYRAVAAAEAQLAMLVTQESQLQASLEGRRTERQEAAEAAQATRLALTLADDAGPRLAEAEEKLAAIRENESRLNREQGSLDNQRNTLRELAARVEAQQESIKAHRDEESTYGDLFKAFGRDGIQAMLIDQALPRLEYTANGMLDRMTGGRITVSLATRKENKAGNQVDTLDIRISDEMGLRDYEMYSGGEAFRVDFALRIALAKLLAETAGADLPTLIIDEGFGSQDSDGIDRLVEAINAVREEFRLILVVTHVEELRSKFERRIEVTKDPVRGSFAQVC